MSENQLHERLERIESKLDEGFSKINGRVKKLEEKDAWREGFEKGMQNNTAKTDHLLARITAVLGIPAVIISIAIGSAALVAKLAGLI